MLGLGRCRHGMAQQHVFGFLHTFQLCGLLLQLDLHGGFRRCMSNALRAADQRQHQDNVNGNNPGRMILLVRAKGHHDGYRRVRCRRFLHHQPGNHHRNGGEQRGHDERPRPYCLEDLRGKGAGKNPQRPVPQVDAVRILAEGVQWLEHHEALHPGIVGDGTGNQQHGQQAGQYDATAEGECILFADNRHGDQGNQAEERQYRCRRIPDAMLHGNLR